MHICVVGRGVSEHIASHTGNAEVPGGVYYRGVGLQFHIFFQAVYVETPDGAFLAGHVGLGIHNRGEYHYLAGEQMQALGAIYPVVVPELLVVLIHGLYHLFGGHGPVELVSVFKE